MWGTAGKQITIIITTDEWDEAQGQESGAEDRIRGEM